MIHSIYVTILLTLVPTSMLCVFVAPFCPFKAVALNVM